MKRTGWPTTLAIASLTGCAGHAFEIEGPLAETPSMPVSGRVGTSAAACEPEAHAPRGLAAGRAATVTIGPLRGKVHAPHRSITTRSLASAAVRADFAELVDALEGAHPSTGAAAKLLADLEHLLALPIDTRETTLFTYRAEVDDRIVRMSCIATNRAATFGVFDRPRFRLSCRVLSSDQHVLAIRGYGAWDDYRFAGELRSPHGKPLEIRSRSAQILSVGMIRGFVVRPRGQAHPSAAIGFWGPGQRGLAWSLEDGRRRDVVLATLGLAYLFPWPTGCDAERFRREALSPPSE